MAATRLITMHQNKGKSVAKSLSDRTDCAKNGEKTENGQFISSYACQAESVDEEFMLSKREYERLTERHHKGNIIAYQIRQSFKPGEITPEEANQVGYETAMRFTKGNYAFIAATHTDKAHIHNHIIFNSTSLYCTHKFRDFFFVGLALQRLSDIICLEHGLSVIEKKKPSERVKRTTYPEKKSFRDDINGDGNHIPGSMSLSFADQEGEMLLHRLDLMKICVSTGSACDSVIVKYLLSEKQRFFNAIVLAIYDGDPKWLEIEFGEEYEEYNNVGFLAFNEDLKVFPVDGQHRVKGIIEALKDNRELEDEEVPVIFIAHKNDDAGKRRTRKLFSTLNRRAKPVGDNYQIALDEDDIAAIVTREVVEEYELFQKERLLNAKKKQIPKTNVNAFTSLIALYHCNEYLIKDKLGLSDTQFKGYKLYRPDEKVIEDMLSYVESFWTSFIDNITVIKEYLSEDEKPALRYRNDKGGNLLFRPIGILEFVKAAVIISKRQNKPFGDVLKEMNKIQLELDSSAWRGVVWDGKKIINRANLNLVRLMIMNLVQDFELSDKEKEQLKDLFISATNFEGDTDSVWDKIMEIKKASSTNTSI